MVNWNKAEDPKMETIKTVPVQKAEVAVVAPKKEEKPHMHVMDFLKQISQELKNATPHTPTLSDKVDAYIREHGNRHPETTVAKLVEVK